MIRVKDLKKVYRGGAGEVKALDGVSMDVNRGEFLSIMGPSGCGKSTLLHCMGGLDSPSGGEITIQGEELHRMDDVQLTKMRRTVIGFVFQFFNLLPTLTLLENVMLPGLLAGGKTQPLERKARQLLLEVDLEPRAAHYPHQLSGGQMQRAALARALIHQPLLLLADEPTGNLDTANSNLILDLLRTMGSRHNTTIIMVTHSKELASRTDRVVEMKDGRIKV